MHLALARQAHPDWAAHLQGLLALLHYADHTEANLQDAYGVLNNVVAIVTADRNVSSRELKRVLSAASDLHGVLHGIYGQAPSIELGEAVRADLGIESWAGALEEFRLPAPTTGNINDWMQVIHGWVSAAASALCSLSHSALQQLLKSEIQIARLTRNPEKSPPAPAAAHIAADYPRLLPGMERSLQKRLGLWDRFQTSDGFFPGLLRILVAGTFIAGALLVATLLALGVRF